MEYSEYSVLYQVLVLAQEYYMYLVHHDIHWHSERRVQRNDIIHGTL